MQLRDYQKESIDALYNYFRGNKTGNPIIVAPTGSGKSVIIAGTITDILTRWSDKRIVVLTHVKELVEQNHGALKRFWKLAPCGIYSAGLGKRDGHHAITFATIQSVAKKPDIIGIRDLIMIDECFVGKTIVNTPSGNKRIDKVALGDIVNNAIGTGKILAISKKKTDVLLVIRLSNGKTITCTREHPFFTRSGWVDAQKLDKGVELICLQDMPELWGSFYTVASKPKKEKQDSTNSSINSKFWTNKVLLNILLQETRESYVGFWGKREISCDLEENRTQTKKTWWKWSEKHSATRNAIKNAWKRLVSRISSENTCWTQKWNISKLLQSGYWQPQRKTCNRGRWIIAHWAKKRIRQKERCETKTIRVESIKVKKQRSGIYVYNLQVSGHPSYFVENVLVHNCHLTSHNNDTSYRKFIAAMEMLSPNVRVVGYTATPYRLDTGLITEGSGAIFDTVAHEIPIQRLLNMGMLSPLVCRYNAGLQAKMDDVRITAGEFNAHDMAEKFEQLIAPVCADIAEKSQDRKSIIVFCPRVDICFKVSNELAKYGIDSDVLSGETNKTQRKDVIDRFKSGALRCIVSVNVITTGFDAPNVDCVVLFRATVSAGLYYQMLGRGMRLHTGKENCLVLDYGGNIKRHGAITAIIPPKKKGAKEIREDEEKEPDMLVCAKCSFVHFKPYPDACLDCGDVFPIVERQPAVDKYNTKAENLDPMFAHSKPPEPPQWVQVIGWTAKTHQKQGKQPTMQVTYDCGMTSHKEWICFEHIGFAGDKARSWYHKMRKNALPDSAASFGGQMTVRDAVNIDFPHLSCPDYIKVKAEGKYWRILDYRWDEIKQEEQTENINWGEDFDYDNF